MTEENSVKPCEFTCAKAFLDALDETDELWREGNWIFRGQSHAAWPLLPSSMRIGDNVVRRYVQDYFKEAYQELLPRREEIVSVLYESNFQKTVNAIRGLINVTSSQMPTPEELYRNRVTTALQSTGERFLAYLLERHADSSNLELPFDRFPTPWNEPVLLARRLLEAKISLMDASQRREPMRIMYALAQHHGLPTRLLDWTYRPLVAAFFAAHSEAKRDRNCQGDSDDVTEVSSDEMVVWAVQQEALAGIQLQVVRHLRRQIGFLGAQDGVFVYDLLADLRRNIFGEWMPFDSLFAPLLAEGNVHKFTLPHTEREGLISLLSKKKISKARLMPSFDNVAEEIAVDFYGRMREYS